LGLMINTSELMEQLQSYVVFDTRFNLAEPRAGESAYLQGHIPGSLHLDMETHLSGEKTQHGGRHPLPDEKVFSQLMQRSGVNKDSKIVLYDAQFPAGAARTWWLLTYFGHKDVAILDGGLKSWIDSGGELTSTVSESAMGDFTANVRANQIVNMADISQISDTGDMNLVDAREAYRYRGESEPIDPVAGHIPGAKNCGWTDLCAEDGRFKSKAELENILEQVLDDRDTTVYCGSGVTASVVLFALTLTGHTAKLYPGSWSDWCSYPNNPVATGS